MQSPKGKLRRVIANLLYAFLAFLAIATAYYNFAVKLSILPSESSIDASNPFATPFILKNDSLLRIYNIKPHRLIIHKVNNRSCNLNINLIAPAIPKHESGEPTSFSLPVTEFEFNDSPINYLNIEIIVFYYPAYLPFYEDEKHARFVTIKSKDGNLHWISKAISE